MTRIVAKARVRTRRRIRRSSWIRVFEMAMQWTIVICAFASVALLFLILAGCAAVGHEQYAQTASAARGCYCAGSNCEDLKSAAGQAAVAAAGGQVVNITKVEKPKE